MNLAVAHLSTHTLLGLTEKGAGLTINSDSKGMPEKLYPAILGCHGSQKVVSEH